ncbi:MAG: sugar ABC transporter permease [Lachnospiraceae bacterium]|nr:sugar ABC transporter permease [Lachnospiraceae bacterium]
MRRKRIFNRKQQDKKIIILLALIPFVGISLFYLFPIFYSIFVSLQENRGGNTYWWLMKSEAFWLAMQNTLLTVVTMVPTLLVISMGLAFVAEAGIKRKSRWWGATLVLHMIPFIIPSTIIAFVVNSLFDNMWIQSSKVFWILFVIYVWKNYGYCMLILLGGIRNIPQETLEAARVDGAGKARILFRIMLPQMKTFISFCIVMEIVAVFKLFREGYLLCGDYPNIAVYFIQNFINNSLYAMSFEKISAMAVVLILVFSAIIYALYHSELRGESYEA